MSDSMSQDSVMDVSKRFLSDPTIITTQFCALHLWKQRNYLFHEVNEVCVTHMTGNMPENK